MTQFSTAERMRTEGARVFLDIRGDNAYHFDRPSLRTPFSYTTFEDISQRA